jgi:hypothetical protein
MSLLLAAVPLYGRILAIVGLVLAVFGYGWTKGAEHGQAKIDAMVGKSATETIRIARARDRITSRVETKYLPGLAKIEVVTQTITKEVPVYVPFNAPALPGGFRVLHDAAAQGQLPDPARIADAAAVPAQDAAGTVAENYGQCRADQLKLQGLQEWITEQLLVNPQPTK